jgi:hypothetical protein
LPGRLALVALGGAAVITGGALTWFGWGDQSEPHGDYAGWFTPPFVDRDTEIGLALMAAVGTVLVGVLADITGRRLGRRASVWKMAVASLALGGFLGGALRIGSAATVGANIGAGLLMITAPFVAGFLLAIAIREGRRATPSRGALPSAPA